MKKIFACSFVALVLILALAAFAGCGEKEQPKEAAGALVFQLNEAGNAYSVVGTNPQITGAIEVPSTYNGKAVIEISREAFQRCENVTSIKLPSTIRKIGPYAFAYCTSITDIFVPKNVAEIDNHAFRSCTALKTVSFEAGSVLTRIGNFAFENCKLITSVSIPSNVSVIGDSAFKDCSALANINMPTALTDLGSLAFNNCVSLTSISFSDNVTKMGTGAFRGCTALTSVYLSASITEVGESLFYDCKNIVSAKAPTTVLGELPKAKLQSLEINGGSKIATNALSDCSELQSVIIANSVVDVGDSAFYNCIKLTNVVFRSGNQTIQKRGKYAFYNCKSLMHVTLPSGLRELGVGVFYLCRAMTSVTLPNSIYSIGNEAFKTDSAIVLTVMYNDTLKKWEGVTKAISIGNCRVVCTDGETFTT